MTLIRLIDEVVGSYRLWTGIFYLIDHVMCIYSTVISVDITR